MDMPMDVFRALIADTISTMGVEQLRNIILQTHEKELGAVGAAVLAEKGKKVGIVEAAVGAVKKKVRNTPGKQTPTAVGRSSKRKRKSQMGLN
jgi:hypothetical protein